MKIFPQLIIFIFLIFGFGAIADVSESDLNFLVGYQNLLDGKYGVAADNFFLSLKSQKQPRELNRALIYLSFAQLKNNNFPQSAYNAVFVNPEELNEKELKLFKYIRDSLGNEYKLALLKKEENEKNLYPLNKLFVSAGTYLGTVNFGNQSSRESAKFQGITGTMENLSWSVNAGYEQYNLNFRDSSPNYKQGQAIFSFTKSLNPLLHLKSRYVKINSELESQNGIQVFGAGLSYWSSLSTKLNFDYYKSIYPKYNLGKLNVDQFSLILEYWQHNTLTSGLWFRVGDQMGKPSSIQINNNSSFIKNKIYNRIFGDFNFRFKWLSYGAGYWIGNEVFGVRNDGYIVFSGLQENIGGANGYLGAALNKNINLNILYSKENIKIDNAKSFYESFTLMLSFNNF